ncbi:erythromycin biosynthesis sensory transduction protein eryC1 [Pseudomonas soli]|uniref:DegT/DnrJ/EryC1/StrS family aminotransferase n=1 Tax=Pseudomonas soli TaxID=1306993 RepID=A0AAJ5MI70_9PSED|nr:DegT/DnrJ/EryC1/StrS family aminotransferase [Pseudomonas soli]MDW9405656.1 aminotransferase class I/II-fold pyridoxal phosphate-dependent enzyme [Pseudomonas soli]PYC43154.1 erythromycin biosynthesis sensory transduction protein eryC1 [Pseudomonas soli]UXZ44321.1 DegT/DnrJ/EryC1/StrS family aminotransferase [Pseudomonas soli]
MVKFLDLHAQYQTIRGEIDAAISDVIANSSFIGGKGVRAFEEAFASYCGARFCLGVGNGTDALEIAIEALDLPPGSEVLVPANSFIASSEAVSRCGHKVVFVDNDADTYVISVDDVLKKLTVNTKAIIAVHLYGHPCDMKALSDICKSRGIYLIEDCAQAHGAEFEGQRVGSIGDISAFSFYPGKNLGAYGDAGAIVTNDEALSLRCRQIANHGRIAKYDHAFEGRNSRLDGLQAAILSVKLKHLDDWTAKRIEIADRYLQGLADVSLLTLPRRQAWAKQVYHLFVIRTEYRDELKAFLEQAGIETGVHYPKALPKLQAYAYLDQEDTAANYYTQDSTLLSLPIGEHLSLSQIDSVIAAVREFFSTVNQNLNGKK